LWHVVDLLCEFGLWWLLSRWCFESWVEKVVVEVGSLECSL
jgi:hypothetical protein